MLKVVDLKSMSEMHNKYSSLEKCLSANRPGPLDQNLNPDQNKWCVLRSQFRPITNIFIPYA